MKVDELFEEANIIDHMASQYGTKAIEVDVEYKTFGPSRSKACFNNAYRYVSDHRGATYVLGYLMHRGEIPIEHAWVKDDNKYYEITLKEKHEGDKYFSFFELDPKELNKIIVKLEHPPAIHEYFRFKKNESQ